MSSRFSRRRAASNPPQNSQNVNPSAALAAVSAFVRSPASNASLSSTAAAAALRSQTTSPEPIGNVQTKRMIRRGSQSSVGSDGVVGSGVRGGGVGRGGLQRTNSGGSMTERTFRSPSPGAASRRGMSSDAVSSAPDAPPVPALPKSIAAGHYKASSSMYPNLRVMSPPPTRGGRSVSVDRGSISVAGRGQRMTGLQIKPELKREGSNGSVNFSRPMSTSSPGTSPHTAKSTARGGSWFGPPAAGDVNPRRTPQAARPTTPAGLRSYEVSGIQNYIQTAANQPVAKKSAATATQGRALGRGTMLAGPTGSAVHSQDVQMVYDPNTRRMVAQPMDAAPQESQPQEQDDVQMVYDPTSRRFLPKSMAPPPVPPLATPAPREGRLNAVQRNSEIVTPTQRKKKPEMPHVQTLVAPPARNPARLSPGSSPISPRAGMLQHHPSVVREEPEAEEQAAKNDSTMPVPLPHTGKVTRTYARPAKVYLSPTARHTRSTSLDVPRPNEDPNGRGRGMSTSPQRSAHFSASPVIGATLHHPPPRAISPAKSAMKSPASSVRTASPMATFSPPGPKPPPSDTSDTTSLASQDGVPIRKKNARVSFDDDARETASSVTAPAPLRAAARARSPVIEDDTNGFMPPRPALPSFGSVRKGRATQPEIVEKVTESPSDRLENSNDFNIGDVISAHHAERMSMSAEQIRSDAPLPPVVTSKDRSVELWDSDGDSVEPTVTSTPAKIETGPRQPVFRDFAAPNKEVSPIDSNSDVPAINLLPPSPGIDELAKNHMFEEREHPPEPRKPVDSMRVFAIPGGWGDEGRESPVKDLVEHHPTDPSLAEAGVSEPSPVEEPTSTRSGTLHHLSAQHHSPYIPPQLEAITESDSDNSAAFSDAAEDLSDLEDGGFASLDAIVQSPIVRSPVIAPGAAVKSPPDSPIGAAPSKTAPRAGMALGSQKSGDWTQATAYWRSLNRQQQQTIEREALSSDDEARPVPLVTKKATKKRSGPKQVAVLSPDNSPGQALPARQQPPPASAAAQRPRQPALKKSMRAQPGPSAAPPADGEVHMRKSMRGDGTMKSSLREGAAPARPQSEYVAPRGALQKRNIRPASSGGETRNSGLHASAVAAAMLQREKQQRPQTAQPKSTGQRSGSSFAKPAPKDDSDSESSFKKKRRPSVSTVDSAGIYSMKRSMRSASVDHAQSMSAGRPTSPTPAGRGRGAFSLRSLSPTGSIANRQTMRGGSMDGGERTMRGQSAQRGDSKARFSMSGFSKPAPAPPAQRSTASRFKSRFVDSDSDDDRARPAGRSFFSSRFADSDDEDERPSSPRATPTGLTPVRGIPRRKGQDDGDSTDLEDEEDDALRRGKRSSSKPPVPSQTDIDNAMAAARRNVAAMNNGSAPEPGSPAGGRDVKEGKTLEKGSLRVQTEGKESKTVTLQSPTDSPNAEQSPQLLNGMAKEKRRGFLSSLIRRNRTSSSSVPQVAANPPANSPDTPTKALHSPPQQEGTPTSATRGGRLVRRASNQPKMARGNSTLSLTTAPPATDASARPEDWPLAPSPKLAASEDRPNTSDGVQPDAIKLARTMRPAAIPRSQSTAVRSTVDGEGGEEVAGGAVYSQRTGRRKKFGGLRKMFRLED